MHVFRRGRWVMDKKEARSILGVNKDASKNDIEKKYVVLLKKYRIEINRLKEAASEAEREEAIRAEQEEAADTAEAVAEDADAGTTDVGQSAIDPEASGIADGGQSAIDPETSGTADGVVSDDAVISGDMDESGTGEVKESPESPVKLLEAEFSRITEAYNVLMGYETKENEEQPGKVSPLFKMVGVNEKKAKNFFYYYKFYILAIILLIVSIIYFVQGCMNRVTPDFNAAFIGRIGFYSATDALSDSVKASIPIIEEPGFDGAYFDDNVVGDQLYAMEMKLQVLFGAADIDVFILDRTYYERFAKQGMFQNLDEIAPRLGADVDKNKELIVAIEKVKDPDDMYGSEGMEADGGPAGGTEADTAEEPHLYGIDVSDSTVLKEAGVIADDMIAAIFLGTEQQEKAEAFLKFLLN